MSMWVGWLFLLLTVNILKSMNIEKDVNRLISSSKNQWRNQKDITFVNIEIPIDLQKTSLSTDSSKFCIPFHTCSTNVNGIILVCLTAFFILIFCLKYHCYEYCNVKRELDDQRLRKSKYYIQDKLSEYNGS